MSSGSEDGDASPARSSSKEKKDSKTTPKNRSENEKELKELKELRVSLRPVTVRLKRADGYLNADQDDGTNGKIPLLDRDPVVDGCRSRKTVNKFSAPVAKRGPKAVEIPRGRGKALGRITTVCKRIEGLDDVLIKALHRSLFGKAVGKRDYLLHNITQFRGFTFEKDSDEYDQKLLDLSKKFNLQEMKVLINVFDLGMNYKSKEEAVTYVLDFLLDPQPSEKAKPVLEGHPRRKATKRDYFEADLALEYPKRKKKKKTAAKESEEDGSPKKSSKSKSNAKTDEEKTEPEKRDDESENEKDNESKKPAKKRKSNQVIDEEGEEESTKNGEALPTKAKKKKASKK